MDNIERVIKMFKILETKNSNIFRYLLLDIEELINNASEKYVVDRRKFEFTKSKYEIYEEGQIDFIIKEINHWLIANQNKFESVKYGDKEYRTVHKEFGEQISVHGIEPLFILWQLKKFFIIHEIVFKEVKEYYIPSKTIIFLKMLKEMNES